MRGRGLRHGQPHTAPEFGLYLRGIACDGGRGRTGTALACLAILDGVPAADAVGYVRTLYHRRAVETPWQRRYVRRFPGP